MDEKYSTCEDRYHSTGFVDGKLITVSYTTRGNNSEHLRLITAWSASAEEEKPLLGRSTESKVINFLFVFSMNLQSIYLKCKINITAIQNLKTSNEKATGANGGAITVTKVEGWLSASASIADLQGIKYLDDYLSTLMNAVPEYFRNDDSFSVKTSDGNNIGVARDRLVRSMNDAIDIMAQLSRQKIEVFIMN